MKPRELTTCTLLRRLSATAAAVFVAFGTAKAADYPTTITNDGAVIYYQFEETTNGASYPTVAADSSGNGNDGSYNYNGEDTSPLLGLPGIDTNSILFNIYNTNESDYGYVDVPNSAGVTPAGGPNGGAFSAELWVQPDAFPGNWSVPLEVAQYPNGWNIYVSGAGDGNGNTSYFYLDMRPPLFQGFGAVPITFFQWYHLVLTFDGTNAIFYINGTANGPYNASGFVPASGSDAHIGSGQGAGWLPFQGGVDEFAFYTNVLTAAQVLNHYEIGTNSFRAVPIPASVVTDPQPTTVFSGTAVTFTTLGQGTSPLTYQWYTNGTAITGATTTSYSLLAQYPQDNNLGFSVIVSNAYGSQTSTVASLTVLTNLNALAPPADAIRNMGSSSWTAFRVAANGALPITYQWFHGEDSSAIAGATNDTLWIHGITTNAEYFAAVYNPFTSVTTGVANLIAQPRAVTNVPVDVYSQVVMADAPVAYYRLDETGADNGTATDAAGSFDGIYNDAAGSFVWNVPSGIPSDTDTGVELVSGSTVQIPYYLELNPWGAWSAELWFNPSSLGANGGDYRVIFDSEWHVYPNSTGWYIYQQPNDTIAFVDQPGNAFLVVGPNDPANGNLLVGEASGTTWS